MIDERCDNAVVEQHVHRVVEFGLLHEDDTAVICYDLEAIDARRHRLQASFPDACLHTAAVKAVGFPFLLERLTAGGVGAEAASAGELALAASAGCSPDHIVFDSPAKTKRELADAIESGVLINLDNFTEVERVAEILGGDVPVGRIGIRVNPQVGVGLIESTSVAGAFSKFGVPLREQRDQIIHAFREHSWLTMLHVHVGSQGTTLPLLTRGARLVLDLADEIGDQVTTIDVGGGLPVSYRRGVAPAPPLEEYTAALRAECPELFGGRYRLVTEFGRWLFANAGFVVSRIEAVKQSGGKKIAVAHVGADLFVRSAYRPDDWFHELTVHRPDGSIKDGPPEPWTVAGPLCFAGDLLATDRDLPAIESGDLVVVHDAGAYTASMYSRYNSRPLPAVVGIDGDRVDVLRPKESIRHIVDSWYGNL